MGIENNSAPIAGIAVLFCPFVAILTGLLGWSLSNSKLEHWINQQRKKQGRSEVKVPMDKLGIALCYFQSVFLTSIALYLFYLHVTAYNSLSLSPDGKSLTATFAFIRGPEILAAEQLKSINIEQEWTSRKFGPENWYKVVPETKAGYRLEPNWSISEKGSPEFPKLLQFVEEMKRLGLPLQFTYKDKQGKTHQTQSLLERPGN